jgi:hypothetical protein
MRSSEILVRQTDKNLGLAIIEKKRYKNMCLDILHDKSTYTYLSPSDSHNLANLLKARCQDFMDKDHIRNNIPSECLKYIDKFFENLQAPSLCKFHGLPKVHKSPLTLRPICSNINFPTYGISRVVDIMLQDLVKQLPSFINNSLSLVITLEKVTIPPGNVTLFTFDVVSLYPSIPTKQALTMIEKFIFEKKLSDPASMQAVLSMLELCLVNNFIRFDDQVFKQIQGTCMGTPSAVVFACLFMGTLERAWMEKHKSKLLLFKRFIDDGFGISLTDEKETQEILEEFNNLHPNIKINSVVSKCSVDFLDLTIYKDGNKIRTKIFQKPLNAYLYLPFSSYHANHVKTGFIRGELIRYVRNCSLEKDFLKIRKDFYVRLLSRGYPSTFLLPIFQNIFFSQRTQFMETKNQNHNNQITWVIPRNQFTNELCLPKFLNIHWFNSFPFPSEVAALKEIKWLVNQPPPTIALRYPPNIRRLLIHTEFNLLGKRQRDPYTPP